MGHLFFFSYARVDLTYDSNKYIELFFKDLRNEVRRLSKLKDEDAFIDIGNLALAEKWEPKIGQALQTSRAFVCMCSGNYFVSEYCGKEFEVFRRRIQHYEGALLEEASASLIVPVLWDPPGDDIPGSLTELQLSSGDLPDLYGTEGLFSIMLEESRARADYNTVYRKIAKSIHENIARFPDLPHLDPFPPLREVRSAFEPSPPVEPPPPARPKTTARKPKDTAGGNPLAPWVEHLGPDAHAALEEALDLAAERGLVSSIDLLVALLSAPGSGIAKAVEREGVDLDAFVAFLRSMLADASAGAPRATLDLSKTVSRTISAAETARGSHETISLHDLETGFASVGGGTAAQVLGALGIALADITTTGEREATDSEDVPDSVFDDAGRLLVRYLDDSTASALRAAALFARRRSEMISTYSLFIGFAQAGSPTLRDALRAQGENGNRAIDKLFPDARPTIPPTLELGMRHFSARSYKTLERAAAARPTLASKIGDAAVLRELLRDEGAAVRKVLEGLGVDPSRLASAIS